MDAQLENELYDKYPKIFRQKDLSCQETCMCWGISTGDGWYDIIDRLCRDIQQYIDEEELRQVEAVQVKEKFGGLRFYTNYEDDHISELIEKAENESYRTCEWCGATENVGRTSGYILTLCKNCAEQDNREGWREIEGDE